MATIEKNPAIAPESDGMETPMNGWAEAVGRLLVLAAMAVTASCGGDDGDGGDGTFTHDGIVDCLEEAGLEVTDGGLLHGEPGIGIEGGSALVVVLDSNETAQGETEDAFWAQGEAEARDNVFVYFAPGATDSTRTEVDSCLPSA
jgi:hypothetical protein